MKFTSNRVFLSISSFLLAAFVVACGVDHAYNKAQYDMRMQQMQKPAISNDKDFNNFWVLAARGRLLKDVADERYDAWIHDGVSPEIYLLIHEGKFLRGRLRKTCGELKGEPETPWLMQYGFDSESPKQSRSHDPTAFLNFLFNEPSLQAAWQPFLLQDRGVLRTQRYLKTGQSDQPDYIEVHVLSVSSTTLEIAYRDLRNPEGVHTTVEIFTPVKDEGLYAVLAGLHPILSKCDSAKK